MANAVAPARTLTCRTCGETKAASHFAMLKSSPTGRATRCKACTNATRRGPVTRRSEVRKAVLKGDAAALEGLTKKGQRERARALFQAAQRGQPALLRPVLESGCREGLNEALIAAASSHHTIPYTPERAEVVRLLLEAGADANSRGGWAHDTPLLAAAKGGYSEIVALLIGAGANIGVYALAALGRVSELKKLLKKTPALATQYDCAGLLALHHCAASGMGLEVRKTAAALAEAAELLIAHGAPVNAPDQPGAAKHAHPGMAPLGYACGRGNRAVAEVLLRYGADVNQRGNWGTPVSQACKHSPDIAELLVARGADVNAALDDEGTTALHQMANFPHPDAVRWLLAHGADVRRTLTDGRTPLHRAAERNSGPAVCAMLLDAGAPLNPRDAAGMTPLAYAVANRKEKVAAFLRSKGGRE